VGQSAEQVQALATMPAWISNLSLRREDASGAFDKSDTEQRIAVPKVAFSHATLMLTSLGPWPAQH